MPNLQEKIKELPQSSGVYLMKNSKGKIIYIGKATSLRNRVASYWTRPHDIRIEQLIRETKDIDYQITPTVIEALVLEANLVKKYQPKYNIKLRDDKSFLYLGITREEFPRLMLLRGLEIEKINNKNVIARNEVMRQSDTKRHPRLALVREGSGGHSDGLETPRFALNNVQKIATGRHASTLAMIKLFGPYPSASSLRAALDIIRKIFPYRSCETMPKRPCLFYQIKRCPAPCLGKISRKDYYYIIRQIILFFQGKRAKIIKNLELKMKNLAAKEKFEQANQVKNQLFALEHIQDVAVIRRDDINAETPWQKTSENAEVLINVFGRIEGYDISNLGGKEATGSMIVFENGKPKKSDYRKFKIKTVKGINDIAMLKETLKRRFRHLKTKSSSLPPSEIYWPKPDLILIDGGQGQINAAKEALKKYKLDIPILGIAKGITRKKDEFIFNKNSPWAPELERIKDNYPNLLKQLRNEAHRFALSYHRKLRKKKFINK